MTSLRGRTAAVTLGVAAAVVALLAVASLAVGAATIDWGAVLTDPEQLRLVTVSRIPRTAAVILAGAAMAVAGLIMQALTRNRYVAPTTAGTIDAAGLGVLVAVLLFAGASVMAKIGIALVFAFAGTALFLLLVERLRLREMIMVPLLGLVLGGIFRATTEMIAYRANLTQTVQVWMNGDFSGVIEGRYETLWLAGAAAAAAYLMAHHLTAAGMGREIATSVGLPYRATLAAGLGVASFATAVVVVTVGAIPFLGLIVPNVVTLLVGDNLRRALPVTALGGAALVLACDLIGRLVIHPYEIPVSSVVGVLGAGVLLALILRKGNRFARA
ncbi:ABC transporter permease [Demequina lignilytica]|uniref:Iron chelate uptake ABC transporter family permease subunit n=1 Tax=Demequina lignilytica TaxID=3051663 RepID=A0AB35MJ40_9MICO|nr:iron chelate uptake ABC transporter family permease subunit [Demequina sp. SYSU T0a273]MDN4483821.1 iron chelate uptake ABC transporter family permease subunit [Demequina sp. SYSU T0a273]